MSFIFISLAKNTTLQAYGSSFYFWRFYINPSTTPNTVISWFFYFISCLFGLILQKYWCLTTYKHKILSTNTMSEKGVFLSILKWLAFSANGYKFFCTSAILGGGMCFVQFSFLFLIDFSFTQGKLKILCRTDLLQGPGLRKFMQYYFSSQCSQGCLALQALETRPLQNSSQL